MERAGGSRLAGRQGAYRASGWTGGEGESVAGTCEILQVLLCSSLTRSSGMHVIEIVGHVDVT